MAQFQIGSISTGTLRPEDLLPAFVSALESLSPMGTNHPYLGDAYQILEQGTDDESETKELLSDIEHELGNLCPPFVYFGTLPGDGADFGFWPDMDSLHEAMQYVQIFPDEVQADYGVINTDPEYLTLPAEGVIVHVNDHGNVTEMDMERNVLWDCV